MKSIQILKNYQHVKAIISGQVFSSSLTALMDTNPIIREFASGSSLAPFGVGAFDELDQLDSDYSSLFVTIGSNFSNETTI